MHSLILGLVAALGTSCASDPSSGVVIGPGLSADPDPISALAAAAGCSAPEAHPPTSQEHVADGTIVYDRLPPDGGAHRPNWAQTGVHSAPIEAGEQTHNLEHGHIGLQYASSVDPALITELNAVVGMQPQMLFSAPFDGFTGGAVLSLTAWGHRVDCTASLTGPDDVRRLVESFVAGHLDQAPESVPGEPLA